MTVHSQYHKRTVGLETPQRFELDRVLNIMEKAYERTVWHLQEDFLSRAGFERALSRLDRKSSPGWPYMRRSPTNGEWLGFNGVWYDPVQVEQLWIDVQWRIRHHPPWYLRVFIKQEPHNPKKVQENRWRLIMASPLDVQVLWHMLFDEQNDKEIEFAYFIPSQQGLVLPNGGWKQFYRLWRSRGYDSGLDKSAWDWTAPGFLLDLDLEFRYRMCRGKQKEAWFSLARRLYDQMFHHSVLMLSDGRLYKQLHPGIMKSGCVNTISTNSHMQVMVHILACSRAGIHYEPLPVCCGDDTLQRSDQTADLEHYAAFGAVIKSASEKVEFVGHEFTDEGPRPLYFEKHLMKFHYVKDELLPEYIDAMARMYCKDPMFSFWEDMADELDVKLKSVEYYQFWYDYDY